MVRVLAFFVQKGKRLADTLKIDILKVCYALRNAYFKSKKELPDYEIGFGIGVA